MISIPEAGDDFHAMWVDLMRLNERPSASWTLIGAHMVALHGWSQGKAAIRPSRDADVLVNVRAGDGTARISRRLEEAGYEMSPPSPEGIGHRFIKGNVRIDVLAPDGLGIRTPRRTLGSAHTVMVPGGSQALQRTSHVEVRSRSATGPVPVPNLLGAILIKARAIAVSDQPAAQKRDLAFLLTLVDEPDALVEKMSPAERGWLRGHPAFANPADPIWIGVESPEVGAIVFRRLTRLAR